MRVNVAVKDVELWTLIRVAVTPVPPNVTDVPLGTKFVPVNVTETTDPCVELFGLTDANDGAAGTDWTEKLTVPLTPRDVDTVKL